MIMNKDKINTLQTKLAAMNVYDIAEEMTHWSREKRVMASRLLPKDKMADVFHLLPRDIREEFLQDYTDEEVASLISNLESDDLVDTIQELPANMVTELLEYVDFEKRPVINQLLNYPEDSVGSLMSIDFVTAHDDSDASYILKKIQDSSGGFEHLNQVYIIDEKRILTGYIHLSDVIKSNGQSLESKIQLNPAAVTTDTDQEDAIPLFNKYKLQSLPVVDSEGRLVGIVTVDDMFDVISEEVEEDFSLMAGVNQSDEPTTYLEKSSLSMVKERMGWLLFLMISATFTGYIIQRYEAVLATNVVLAAYIPMLMDSGGNAGSQSSTMVTRAISVREVASSDFWSVLKKETTIGLVTGSGLAFVNFFRILLMDSVSVQVNFTICITLVFTVLLSKIIGGLLPIVADSINQDPAVMAGPVITTLVDIFALVVYFQIATLLLGI